MVVPAFIATATEDEAPTCLTFGPMNVSTVSTQPHAVSGVCANVYAPSAMKSYLPALNALKCGSPLPAQVDIVPSGMSGAQVQADCAEAWEKRPRRSARVWLLTIMVAAVCGAARRAKAERAQFSRPGVRLALADHMRRARDSGDRTCVLASDSGGPLHRALADGVAPKIEVFLLRRFLNSDGF